MTNLVHAKNISVDGKDIEPVTSYKYLDHEIKIGRDNQICELVRRISLSCIWKAEGPFKIKYSTGS